MVDTLGPAQKNVYEAGNSLVIHANREGRITYLLLTAPFFILLSYVLLYVLIHDLIESRANPDYFAYLLFLGGSSIFGYMSISYLIQLINIKELVLLPDQHKVQVRLERNRRVVSEHPIEHVSLTRESVGHEEPYRSSMKWFTVYDTESDTQLISIRPGTRDTEAMAVEELTEFFNAVMRPAETGKRD